MKKRIIISTWISFITIITFAQEPVQWNYSIKKSADKTCEVHITATIDDNWHLYSQNQPEDAIAIPTRVKFNKNPLLMLIGKVKEIGRMERYTDKTLGITQNQYARKVDFVQVLKLKGNGKTNVTGSVKFQTCTDERCLPPKTINFSLAIKEG